MADRLDLEQRARRPQVGGDAAELTLEGLRIPPRHDGPQLLAAGVGELDELVDRALGHPHGHRAVQQGKELSRASIERSRYTRRAAREIEEVRGWYRRIPDRDVMAAGAL